jgi:hypothetical protein
MNSRKITGSQMTFVKGQQRPPNAGRKRGTKNKRTVALTAASEKGILVGLMPLDYFLGIVRDPSKDERLRFDAAKAAAPFVHPRLQTTDNRTMLVTEDPNKSSAELRAELAQMLADLGLPEEILNAIVSPDG